MTDSPYTPRREDRAVEDDDWIRQFLHEHQWGVLATVSDGQPFQTPLIYVYDPGPHELYVHMSPNGVTPSNVEGHDRVSFNVSEMGRILPNYTPLEFSNEYAGVTVFGRGRLLEDLEEKRAVLERLMRKYAPHLEPGADYDPMTEGHLGRTAVVGVDIEEWSAKRNVADPDFPGAYDYEAVRTDEPPE